MHADFRDGCTNQTLGSAVHTGRYKKTCSNVETRGCRREHSKAHYLHLIHHSVLLCLWLRICLTQATPYQSQSVYVSTCQSSNSCGVSRAYEAAMKSSKQLTYVIIDHQSVLSCIGTYFESELTLRSLVPARCHSSPNSLPPLMLGTARTALYARKIVRRDGLKNGLIAMLNPP